MVKKEIMKASSVLLSEEDRKFLKDKCMCLSMFVRQQIKKLKSSEAKT